jgi:hypothetical protein
MLNRSASGATLRSGSDSQGRPRRMIPPGANLSLYSASQIDQNWNEIIMESRRGAVPEEKAGARDMRTPAVQADVPVTGLASRGPGLSSLLSLRPGSRHRP